MDNVFSKRLEEDKKIIDNKIIDFFSGKNVLENSMNYAIRSGKRIRPILMLETYKMLNNEIDENVLRLALSLEFIHNYSLVHDDLPEMDNDDYRRGEYTVHKKYGSDIAVLCGDCLLNYAYENIFSLLEENNDINVIKASKVISNLCGINGMIEGQLLDIEHKLENLDDLLKIYEKKTADLFIAAVMSSGYLSNLEDEKLNNLYNYAYNMGISFQIQDDLLDEFEDEDINILNIMPKDQAIKLLYEYSDNAKKSIQGFKNNEFHIQLIDYLVTRKF
ncbi:MAG: polyprenyl synthetase family protein [Tissierellia bacterium]|nr:polyprenyl synthetase family protein [Tissierellia bacterium]